MCTLSRCFVGCIIVLWTAAVAFSQATSTVQISGVVTDSTGAFLTDATVKAIQTDTTFTRTVQVDAHGNYILNNLPIGPYRLEVTARGFKTYVQRGIVLEVNTNPVINVVLEVGALSQQIDVRADVAMVETQKNSVSQVIDPVRMVDLPLNGRQATQLVLLSGAASISPGVISSKNYPTSVPISVAGGQSTGTYYLVDGGDYMDAFTSVNLPFPFPDALQEFSIQTGTIAPNYGVRAGGVVNVITKSGTNEIHGGLFEFVRTGSVNARNFFAVTPDNLKRNQFGATIGAPIQKNKLFFFAGYQGTRTRSAPPTTTVFVPNANVLGGDLSTLESAACGTARTLTDPSTHQPFPNNFIPTSRFNPSAVAILKLVPLSSDPCGQVVFSIPNNLNEDQIIGRVDWIRSVKHVAFGRYFMTNLSNPAVFDGKNILLTTQPGVRPRIHSVVVGESYIPSATVINSVHVAYNNERVLRAPASGLPSAGDMGINIAPSPGNFPNITVSGRFTTTCGTCALGHVNNTGFQVADDLSVVRGRHQLSIGGELIRHTLDFSVTTNLQAAFSFNGSQTGDALADFLLGLPVSFSQGNVNNYNAIQNYVGIYIDDRIRLNSHLSINIGGRWEPYFPVYDKDGRAYHFDLTAYSAGSKSTRFVDAPPGFAFAKDALNPGDPGVTRSGTNHRLAGFAPRAGLVWDTRGDGRTVIRLSYGMMYDLPYMEIFNRFGIGTPWGSFSTLVSPVGGLSDPYKGVPGGDPFPQPDPRPVGLAFAPGGQFINLPLDIRPTYMQPWNLTVQKQVGVDWLFSGSYLGSKTTHIWMQSNVNPAVYIPGVCGSQPCSTVANTNQRQVLTLLNPTEGAKISTLIQLDDGGNCTYEGLLLSAKHRLSRAFSVLANYSWAHCLSDGGTLSTELTGTSYQNPLDRSADRGNCEATRRQIFNGSVLVTTPHFHSPVEQKILGNFEFAAIISKTTGLWATPTTGTDSSLTNINADRPNVVGQMGLSQPTIRSWFNTSAFVRNSPGSYGNAGRDIIETPGTVNCDVAVMRRFIVRERHKFQVRVEAFNALNHPNFNAPTTSMASASFGRILSALDPRILQFGLKYEF